jgi:hypothetical protein
MRRIAVLLGGLCLGVWPCVQTRAQSLDDFLAQGYSVVRTTVYPGAFDGCRKSQTIQFADGSRFFCGATRPQFVYAPRVLILRKDTDAPSAVIVGGRPLKGALVQLGQQHFGTPLNIQEDPLDLAVPPPAPPQTGALQAVEPVQSLNQLQQTLSTRLNDAQSKPLDPQIVPSKR